MKTLFPHLKKYFLFLIVPFLLAGCTGLVEKGPALADTWVPFPAGQTAGQSFVAHYDGLSAVSFYLAPSEFPASGRLTLHLRADPTSTEDLAFSTTILSVDRITSPTLYSFFFHPERDSNQKYYYAFLEFSGSGEIKVAQAPANSYLDGAFYASGEPQESQSAFQLSYSRRQATLGLILEGISWIGILLAAFFLFVLPGWGIFGVLWPGWPGLSGAVKLALSIGISLAIYPLLLLWTDLLGFHLGAVYAWFPPLLGLVLLLWSNRRSLRFPRWSGLFHSTGPLSLFNFVFLFIVLLIITIRFWVVRSLDLPLWGDSYQHTMISQLIVDNGGLFRSWQPYAELTTFTYHFGFHSLIAVFHWLTQMEMPRAVLFVGQLLNAFAAITLFPLAVRITHNRWAALAALLVAGLVSPMPMFYVNWGRYTQLAGQVILPILAWVLWEVLTRDRAPGSSRSALGAWIAAAFLFGGLALTHYRVLILALAFLVPLFLLFARRHTWLPMLKDIFWMGLGGGLLFLPWFIRVFGGRIIALFSYQFSLSAAQAVENDPSLLALGNLSPYLPSFLWLALIAVIALGLWRRDKAVLLFSGWWVLNFLVANPWLLGLPGSGAITAFAVLIGIYIPAGLLCAAAVGWLLDAPPLWPRLAAVLRPAVSCAAALLLIGLSAWGLSKRLKDVEPYKYALAARPDLRAAGWIQANTPPGSRILVNSFPAFRNYVVVGSDGGWWLPFLAGRLTSVPPLNYGFEKDPFPGFRQQTNQITASIQSLGIQDPSMPVFLNDRGISYIYIGQLNGSVNSPGPLFTPAQLLASPSYSLVYHQDRVWIFAVGE